MSKNDLRVYQEAIEKRVQNLTAVIAQYEENNFEKYLDLKLALGEVSAVAYEVGEVLEWDHSL